MFYFLLNALYIVFNIEYMNTILFLRTVLNLSFDSV